MTSLLRALPCALFCAAFGSFAGIVAVQTIGMKLGHPVTGAAQITLIALPAILGFVCGGAKE